MRSLGKAYVKGRQTPLGLYEVYEGLAGDLVARREASKQDFERGVVLYSQGRFVEAQNAFNAVLEADPDDGTARYYLERCFEWAERNVPQDWDGAIVMADK
jgi:two-component system sensor histidine kinase ChiS